MVTVVASYLEGHEFDTLPRSDTLQVLSVYLGKLKNKIQIDATYYFILLKLSSTYFGHHYAHRQELTTIALVTT